MGWIAISCGKSSVDYLDSDFPERTPKKYAEGIVNVSGRHQQNLTMTSDGKEVLITQTNSEEWRYERILRIKSTKGKWSIDTPRFVSDFQFSNEWFIGEPMISPENNKLFFVADYPPDLWESARLAGGDWGMPTKMTISTEKDDWYPTLSKRGTLYFTNGTGLFSRKERENYTLREVIAPPLDSMDLRDPMISPNEDYLIFSSRPNPSEEQTDLYVSFAKEDRTWSNPINLGDEVNTNQLEFAPYISPDEKFLFFSRRDKWINADSTNIYWVSMQLIDALHRP